MDIYIILFGEIMHLKYKIYPFYVTVTLIVIICVIKINLYNDNCVIKIFYDNITNITFNYI